MVGYRILMLTLASYLQTLQRALAVCRLQVCLSSRSLIKSSCVLQAARCSYAACVIPSLRANYQSLPVALFVISPCIDCLSSVGNFHSAADGHANSHNAAVLKSPIGRVRSLDRQLRSLHCVSTARIVSAARSSPSQASSALECRHQSLEGRTGSRFGADALSQV